MKYRIEYYRVNGEETNVTNIELDGLREANIYASKIIAEAMDGTVMAIIHGEDGEWLHVNPFSNDDSMMEGYLGAYGYKMNKLHSGAWQCLDEDGHEFMSTVGADAADEKNYSYGLVCSFDALAEKNGDSHLI
ncbi:MAG: hypothetical protein KBT28_00060 [Bacteroidales bacterium]|nr:hypothetical protein [Candidatus Colimorpha merdihippi]